MNTIRRTIVAVAAAAALATALAAPAVAGDTGAPLRSPVGDWRTSTNGVKQTITFTTDGQVYGDSGCNRFTGTYTTDGDRISIGPLASTMMACPQRQMDAEATFLTRPGNALSCTRSPRPPSGWVCHPPSSPAGRRTALSPPCLTSRDACWCRVMPSSDVAWWHWRWTAH